MFIRAVEVEVDESGDKFKRRKQKPPWPEVVNDMGRDNIARTCFETTGSRIVAAAGYRFRQGILESQDQGAGFKAMMREINGAVGKYRIGS